MFRYPNPRCPRVMFTVRGTGGPGLGGGGGGLSNASSHLKVQPHGLKPWPCAAGSLTTGQQNLSRSAWKAHEANKWVFLLIFHDGCITMNGSGSATWNVDLHARRGGGGKRPAMWQTGRGVYWSGAGVAVSVFRRSQFSGLRLRLDYSNTKRHPNHWISASARRTETGGELIPRHRRGTVGGSRPPKRPSKTGRSIHSKTIPPRFTEYAWKILCNYSNRFILLGVS